MSAPTDTEMLDWLIRGGYCPAQWRPATMEELRAGLHRENGMIFLGLGDRSTIAKAMGRVEAEPEIVTRQNCKWCKGTGWISMGEAGGLRVCECCPF